MDIGLIGRRSERRQLNEALAAPDVSQIRIAGPSGSGKTALAMVALADAANKGALTGWGKYTEGETRSAFGPVMAGLSQIVGHAIDQLYEPQAGLNSLAAALGEAYAALAPAGLTIDGLVVPAVAARGGRREGVARITAATLTLARWLDGFGCAIVLLIDDAFRAPPEAAALLAALAGRSSAVPWTIVSTVRANDGKTAHGAYALLLAPMPTGDRLALLERVLGSAEAARAVFDWFGPDKLQTPGNLLEAARAIQRSKALATQDGHVRIVPARLFQGAGDVLQSVAYRIGTLSSAADLFALAAALWGDTAPLDGLAHALNWARERLAGSADELAQAGIAVRNQNTLRFTHDQVRAAVLNAAGAVEHQRICARMAAQLINGGEPAWAMTALHFRLAAGLDDTDAAVWRDRFADGAATARGRADAAVASAFAEAAWQLRERAGPSEGRADRRLLKEALLAAADRADVAAATVRARLLIDGVSGTAEMAEAYELAVYALWTAGAPEACWTFVREGLRRFGLHIPARVTRAALLRAVLAWRLRLAITRVDAVERSDPACDGIVRIAHAAAYPAFERDPKAAMLLALKGSSRARGRTQSSGYWMAVDAFLSASLGRFADAARFGDRAVAASHTLSFSHAATLYRARYFGSVWRTPQADLRAQCREIFSLAVDEGDLATASGALRNWLVIGWRTSPSLLALQQDIAEVDGVLTWLYSGALREFVDTLKAVIADLTEPCAAYRADRFPWTPSQPLSTLEMRSYLQDWAGCLSAADNFRPLKHAYSTHPGGPVWRFHECLARLKAGNPLPRADFAYLKNAAALNPQDCGAKLAIIEAEQLAQARSPGAPSAYARAVELALERPHPLEAGIAAELARDCARAFGKDAIAEHYAARAAKVWQDWGARAKERPHQAERDVDKLNQARAEASAAAMSSRAKSRLLADVAHELRTPMQGMQSLLDLAADRPETLDLGALRDVLASLKTITDDLTDYGALSADEVVLPRRQTALHKLLESEARIFEDGKRTIDLVIAADVPALVAVDGDRVRQVLRNLLSNAAKYGGPWIGVFASAKVRPDGSFAVTVCVEDDGHGLSDGELLLIFEPFERGGRQGDGRGLGLGLALARRVAQRLDGDLVAENRRDGGARFIFTFEAGAISVGEPQASVAVAARPLSILLAEDVALNRAAMADLLRREGHHVVEACDGVEAIAALQRGAFDAAFVDLSMPRASGQEVLQAIAASTHGKPYAIVLTAGSDPARHDAARAAGAQLVLQKPPSLKDLRDALGPLMEESLTAAAPAGLALGEIEIKALARAAKDEIRTQTNRLIAAMNSGDASAEQAHRLAGLAAQFGAPRIAEIADSVSERLQRGTADAAAPEMAALLCDLRACLSDIGTAP